MFQLEKNQILFRKLGVLGIKKVRVDHHNSVRRPPSMVRKFHKFSMLKIISEVLQWWIRNTYTNLPKKCLKIDFNFEIWKFWLLEWVQLNRQFYSEIYRMQHSCNKLTTKKTLNPFQLTLKNHKFAMKFLENLKNLSKKMRAGGLDIA